MSFLALLLAMAANNADGCRYDRAAMLALEEDAFDQDLTGGWRALEQRGCKTEAADLLRDYRDAAPRRRAFLLFWHEGQLRADLGQTDAAIILFEHSYRPDNDDHIGWNRYVDGSIAFLRQDRSALQNARDTLSQLPSPKEPPSFTINGQKIAMEWPPNLNVLDGFLKCFDKPYAVAYASTACTATHKVHIKDK